MCWKEKTVSIAVCLSVQRVLQIICVCFFFLEEPKITLSYRCVLIQEKKKEKGN